MFTGNPIVSPARSEQRWRPWKSGSWNPIRISFRICKTVCDIARAVSKEIVREAFHLGFRLADTGSAWVLDSAYSAGYYTRRKSRVRSRSEKLQRKKEACVHLESDRAHDSGERLGKRESGGISDDGRKKILPVRKKSVLPSLKKHPDILNLSYPTKKDGRGLSISRSDDFLFHEGSSESMSITSQDIASSSLPMSIFNSTFSRQSGLLEDLELLFLTVIDRIYESVLSTLQNLHSKFNSAVLSVCSGSFAHYAPFNLLKKQSSVFRIKTIFLTKTHGKKSHRLRFKEEMFKWYNAFCDAFYQLIYGGIDDRGIHDFVLSAGYPYEYHEVTTADGYILSLDRIPRKTRGSNKIVLFQHGLLDTAYAWISTTWSGDLATNCAFMAYTLEYDVFLGNLRGTRERKHTKSDISASSYWDFSINEHGIYDIDACINEIRKIKKAEGVLDGELEITLVAHSLGGAASLIYLTEKLRRGEHHYLLKLITMSPAGCHNHLSRFLKCSGCLFVHIMPFFISGIRFPSALSVALLCKIMQDLRNLPATRDLMAFLLSRMVVGGKISESAFSKVGNMIFNVLLSGTSMKVGWHFWTIHRRRKFELFDYGEKKNLEVYGSRTPPNVLDNYIFINIPVHFLSGEHDNLIPPEDILVHYNALKSHHPSLSHYHCLPQTSHLHFTYGQNGPLLEYLANELKNHTALNCNSSAAPENLVREVNSARPQQAILAGINHH